MASNFDEPLSGLTEALYEESDVKGLDKRLLNLNREKLKNDLKEEKTKNQTFVTPKFRSLMTKQIYSILVPKTEAIFRRRKTVIEFDTSHDFFDRKYKEPIPKNVLGRKDDRAEEKAKTVTVVDSDNIIEKIKLSLQNFKSSNKKMANIAKKQNSKLSDSAKNNITKVKKFSKIDSSESEDIFENVGAYKFKPMADFDLEHDKSEKTKHKMDREKNKLRRYKTNKIPASQNKMLKEKPQKPRYKKRKNNDCAKESEHKTGKSPKRFLNSRTEALPASKLAKEVRKNLAPRNRKSIYSRIEAEIKDESGAAKEEIENVGFKGVFRDTVDPYDIYPNTDFNANLNAESDSEKMKNKLKKPNPKSKSFKSGKKVKQGIKKHEKQWEKIKQKLKQN
ncbi:hypothetical protein MHBO_001361 [Bonamia ostreae]|uniref:Uncharacterized protein n=1 Tax=Bonamia ostreae TaxID=126728 RepID=A0ABV2AIP3_9EUKA